MNDELRNYALDQMHHRLRQVRAYSLFAEGGLNITVHAALVKSDPPTVSNPANQRTLSRAADAADDGSLFSWLDEEDGKPQLLTLAQIRSLAESLSAFETDMYDFLDKLSGEIDSGVITTFEQVDHSAWPS
ncbi:MAG: hypothetical protein WA238_18930 [Methylocella sp.]